MGGTGDDILNGEDGNDLLIGGLGNDQYYYTSGGGVDVVDNTGGGFDGIFFLDGVSRNQLSFHQDGDDLVILVNSDLEQQVRVLDHFLDNDTISYVQPDDGGPYIPAANIPGLLEALPGGAQSTMVDRTTDEPMAIMSSSDWGLLAEDEVLGSGNQGMDHSNEGDVATVSAHTITLWEASAYDGLVNAMASFGAESGIDTYQPQESRSETEAVIAASS